MNQHQSCPKKSVMCIWELCDDSSCTEYVCLGHESKTRSELMHLTTLPGSGTEAAYRSLVIQVDGVPDATLGVNQAFMLGGDHSANIYLPDMWFASSFLQVHHGQWLNTQPSSWHAQFGANNISDFVCSMSHCVQVALPLSRVAHVQHNSKVCDNISCIACGNPKIRICYLPRPDFDCLARLVFDKTVLLCHE